MWCVPQGVHTSSQKLVEVEVEVEMETETAKSMMTTNQGNLPSGKTAVKNTAGNNSVITICPLASSHDIDAWALA